jgi:hypothetical protein
VFVILSAAMPSRLLRAFPPGVPVRRIPLDEAIGRVEEFLAGTRTLQIREGELTEPPTTTAELTHGGSPPGSGEEQ